jgi:hypothetical protein
MTELVEEPTHEPRARVPMTRRQRRTSGKRSAGEQTVRLPTTRWTWTCVSQRDGPGNVGWWTGCTRPGPRLQKNLALAPA